MNKPGSTAMPDEVLSANSTLIEVLYSFHPVSADIINFLANHCFCIEVPRKTVLVASGQQCNHIYFIEKGLMRGYIKEKHREITTWITAENEMVTSISGLAGQPTSAENIQTLEDCRLIALSYKELERLYAQFPEFNIVIRKLLQQYYFDAENRAIIARLSNAEKRYRKFLDRHANLANRAPLQYIASYLGLTLETISRVRKKIASSQR